jgi:excisionase family DNA binding protein
MGIQEEKTYRVSERDLQQLLERACKRSRLDERKRQTRLLEVLQDVSWVGKTWLTPKEAAAYADISTDTLRRWRDQGLSSRRRGQRVYIKRQDLDAFIAEGAEGH